MFKQAWKSYITSLHPRNYKKLKNPWLDIMWFYWFFINPIMNGFDHSGDTMKQISFYIANLTPYMLMCWSNLSERLPMPKQMYLLPMKQPERGNYIHTLLRIKIGFPVLVGVLLQVIRGLIYEFEPLRILACTAATLSFGIGMHVCSSLRSKFDRYIRYAVRGEDGTGKDAWLNWICMIYSAIYHFIAAGVEIEIEGTASLLSAIFWESIPLAIMIIIDIAIIKTRYLWTIVDACNYEENFNILGRVK